MKNQNFTDNSFEIKEQIKELNSQTNELKRKIKQNTQLVKSLEHQLQRLNKKQFNKSYRNESYKAN